MEKNSITGYKGFNSDMTCINFQYEVGKEYAIDGNIELNKRGFHACENPFDVLDHYWDMMDKRYCIVEQYGDIQESNDKCRIVSSKIKIKEEIGREDLFNHGIEWLKSTTIDNNNDTDDATIASNDSFVKINTSGEAANIGTSGHKSYIYSSGDYTQVASSGNGTQIGSMGFSTKIASSGEDTKIGAIGEIVQIASSGQDVNMSVKGRFAQVASSGHFAQITLNGESSKIVSCGNYDNVESNGDTSVVMCAGKDSYAKAKKGSWITIAEWKHSEEKDRLVPICVKTEYVDGERIKEDTWYKLENGEFVEVTFNCR